MMISLPIRNRRPSISCRALLMVLLVMLCGFSLSAGDPPPHDPTSAAFGAVGARPERGYFSVLPWERVDAVNGSLTLTFTDLVLPGNAGLDLRITRTYRHQEQSHSQWTFGFTGVPIAAIMPAAPDPPSLYMADGSTQSLHNGVVAGFWITTDFWRFNPSTRKLYLPNGSVATYGDPGVHGGWGWLENVQDVFGNSITATWDASHRLTKVEQTGNNPARTVTFAYETGGFKPTKMTYEGRDWLYSYESSAPYRLTSAQPPTGAAWSFAYGSNALTVTTPNGGTVAYAFEDQDGRSVVRTATTGGRAVKGGTWTFGYAAGGNATTTTVSLPLGRTIRFVHDWFDGPDGKLWALRERSLWDGGTEVSRMNRTYVDVPFLYPSAQYLKAVDVQTITQDGVTFTTDYDYSSANFRDYLQPNQITESASNSGTTRVTTRTFDDGFAPAYILPRVSSTTVSVGGVSHTSTMAYNHATGFLTSHSALGITTAFAPDTVGNLATVTDSHGHTTATSYQWGVPSSVSTPTMGISRTINSDGTVAEESRGGQTTGFTYDAVGRLRVTTPPAGAAATTDYAADGSSVTMSRSNSSVTTTVDGFGRPLSTMDAVGVQTFTDYDVEGRRTFQSAPFTGGTPGGNAFTYDALGRLTSIRHADNTTVTYSYSGTDVAVTDENGHTTTQHWETFGAPGNGRLASVRDAANQLWSYQYNALGSLTRVIAPEGPDRTWAYNGSNQVTSESQPESGTTTYDYDSAGLLYARTDARNRITTYQYDGDHRVISIDAPGTADDVTFEYDGRGLRTRAVRAGVESRFGYDPAGRLSSREDRVHGQVYTTQYGYDARDNLTSLTYPSGRVVQYEYDAANRITRVYGSSGNYANNLTYHSSGALASMTFGNNTTETLTLDTRLRPAHLVSGAVDLTYTYEPNGNVATITDPRPNMSSAFVYDSLDRLTSVGGYGAISYTYDALGNRLTKGSGPLGVTYNYHATTNRLTSATSSIGPEAGQFTYDDVGNLTGDGSGIYTYDARNQMTTATLANATTTYTYDADGLRTAKASPAGQQYYVHGPGGQLIAEYATVIAKVAPVSGTIGGATTVTLQWSALPGATYEVCWDTSNNNTCDTAWQSTAGTPQRVLTDLTPATYYWQVRATTASGTAMADHGVWWSFTVVEAVFFKLGPVSQSTVGSTVTLQWSSVYDSGYWVCWDTTDNDSCDGSWVPNGGGTSKLLEGLTPGAYYWHVRAQTPNGWADADGGGRWWKFTVSGSGAFVKLGPANGASGLTGDVNLQWSSIPDSGYWVCWDQIDNGQCDSMWWPNGGGTIRQVSGLAEGTYYWQARVWDGTNTWDADTNAWWTFTVGTPVITFGKLTPAAGAILTTNATTLTWTEATGASFYETCVDKINNGVCDAAWINNAQSRVKEITGLTDGVYYWQVRAQTATGTTQADVGRWFTLTIDAPDPVREYIYLGGRLLATVSLATGTPIVSYYHTDVLGSVRAISDAAGVTAPTDRFDYFPFGETTAPVGGDPRKYIGGEIDAETTFEYLGARYYKNLWGRLTSVDPIISAGAAVNPQLWNRYSYALNSPLRFSDPSGLEPEESDDKSGTGLQVDDVYFVSYQEAITAFWVGLTASLNSTFGPSVADMFPPDRETDDQWQGVRPPEAPLVPQPATPQTVGVGQAALDCAAQRWLGISFATVTTYGSLPKPKAEVQVSGHQSGRLLGAKEVNTNRFRAWTLQEFGRGPAGITWKPVAAKMGTRNLFGQVARSLPFVSGVIWAYDIGSIVYCTYKATR